jgi:hypothetical protein
MTYLATLAVVALAGQNAPKGGQMGFSCDIEASFAQARRTGRPIMIYFTAEW